MRELTLIVTRWADAENKLGFCEKKDPYGRNTRIISGGQQRDREQRELNKDKQFISVFKKG